ncbi:uncharacterized protein BDR25DRAFT_348517 [Lindgomyces ingoldianus]|uniref:Uncharacterized protein n=1 Tax=Lindgomyces ingoldianus TaxID=673940 RepID=A0ACB6RGL0_9PLEO|nr:uncharacterized protein BDR25DRAFT_348517 [Lindgomyces ingoldianus]KAF2478256.1 hypothetical protein BDR25DRAFT_348517 [Lindgomyces ingoldianus]
MREGPRRGQLENHITARICWHPSLAGVYFFYNTTVAALALALAGPVMAAGDIHRAKQNTRAASEPFSGPETPPSACCWMSTLFGILPPSAYGKWAGKRDDLHCCCESKLAQNSIVEKSTVGRHGKPLPVLKRVQNCRVLCCADLPSSFPLSKRATDAPTVNSDIALRLNARHPQSNDDTTPCAGIFPKANGMDGRPASGWLAVLAIRQLGDDVYNSQAEASPSRPSLARHPLVSTNTRRPARSIDPLAVETPQGSDIAGIIVNREAGATWRLERREQMMRKFTAANRALSPLDVAGPPFTGSSLDQTCRLYHLLGVGRGTLEAVIGPELLRCDHPPSHSHTSPPRTQYSEPCNSSRPQDDGAVINVPAPWVGRVAETQSRSFWPAETFIAIRRNPLRRLYRQQVLVAKRRERRVAQIQGGVEVSMRTLPMTAPTMASHLSQLVASGAKLAVRSARDSILLAAHHCSFLVANESLFPEYMVEALAVGQWPFLHLVRRLTAFGGSSWWTAIEKHPASIGSAAHHRAWEAGICSRGPDSGALNRPAQSHHVQQSVAEGQQKVVPSVRASCTSLAWAKVEINVQRIRRDVEGADRGARPAPALHVTLLTTLDGEIGKSILKPTIFDMAIDRLGLDTSQQSHDHRLFSDMGELGDIKLATSWISFDSLEILFSTSNLESESVGRRGCLAAPEIRHRYTLRMAILANQGLPETLNVDGDSTRRSKRAPGRDQLQSVASVPAFMRPSRNTATPGTDRVDDWPCSSCIHPSLHMRPSRLPSPSTNFSGQQCAILAAVAHIDTPHVAATSTTAAEQHQPALLAAARPPHLFGWGARHAQRIDQIGAALPISAGHVKLTQSRYRGLVVVLKPRLAFAGDTGLSLQSETGSRDGLHRIGFTAACHLTSCSAPPFSSTLLTLVPNNSKNVQLEAGPGAGREGPLSTFARVCPKTFPPFLPSDSVNTIAAGPHSIFSHRYSILEPSDPVLLDRLGSLNISVPAGMDCDTRQVLPRRRKHPLCILLLLGAAELFLNPGSLDKLAFPAIVPHRDSALPAAACLARFRFLPGIEGAPLITAHSVAITRMLSTTYLLASHASVAVSSGEITSAVSNNMLFASGLKEPQCQLDNSSYPSRTRVLYNASAAYMNAGWDVPCTCSHSACPPIRPDDFHILEAQSYGSLRPTMQCKCGRSSYRTYRTLNLVLDFARCCCFRRFLRYNPLLPSAIVHYGKEKHLSSTNSFCKMKRTCGGWNSIDTTRFRTSVHALDWVSLPRLKTAISGYRSKISMGKASDVSCLPPDRTPIQTMPLHALSASWQANLWNLNHGLRYPTTVYGFSELEFSGEVAGAKYSGPSHG